VFPIFGITKKKLKISFLTFLKHSINPSSNRFAYIRLINGRLSAQNMKENIINLLRIWNKWGIFDEKFLFGLETTFLRKNLYDFDEITDDKDTWIELDLKLHLRKKLDELKYKLNSTPEKTNFLEKQCKIYGLSFCEGQEEDIISRILSYEERKFLIEKEVKNTDLNVEEDSNHEVLTEYNDVIDKLKRILNSLQKSYKKIDENYIDGVKIDHLEYGSDVFILEVFNIVNSDKKNKKNTIVSFEENIDGEELNEKEKNEIDGGKLENEDEKNEIKNLVEADLDGEELETLPEEKIQENTKKDIEMTIKVEEPVVDDIDGEPLEEDFL
jgi:hypothetical protein